MFNDLKMIDSTNLRYSPTNHLYKKKGKDERCVHCKYKHSIACEGSLMCSESNTPPFYNRLDKEILIKRFRIKYLKWMMKSSKR